MREIQKAVTFRASSIGDCLMGKYLLETIRAQCPNARLALVVAGRGAMVRDLLKSYPWIEVVEVNRRNVRGLWRLWKEYKNSDLVVTQYAGKVGGKFSLLSKLAARLLARQGALIGFTDASRINSFLYDKLLPFDPTVATAEHERRALLAGGVKITLPYPVLSAVPDSTVLKKYTVAAGKYILVHLFSGSKKRGLSPARRRELVAALGAALPGMALLVSGGKEEAAEAAASCEGTTSARSIAGEASLQEMTQLVLQAGCTVSLDTGVAHIAAQLRRPVLVLCSCVGAAWWLPGQYGPDAPVTVFRRQELCAGGHRMVDYPPCLNAVDFKEVSARA